MTTRRKIRPAMALIAALWVTVLMTVLVGVAAQSSLLDSRISQVENEKQRGRWAARGGMETAVALLLEDDRSYDGLTDVWADYPQELEELDFGGATVSVQVVDTASKLNVNIATREQLLWLPDMTEDIADSILDWVDADDEVRAGGAESGYYLNLDIGYWSRNGAMRTLRELLRVRGVTEGLFYGDSTAASLSADNEGWIHYLTCSSRQLNQDASGAMRVNVNRANEQTLQQQLELTPGQARWVVENRPFSRLADMAGQGQAAQPAQQTQPPQTQLPAQQAPRQTQPPSAQQPSRQDANDQQPEAEPPTLETVLGLADKVRLNNRRYVDGKVNINTAGETVLTALFEGNRELAENLIAAREGLGGAFLNLTDLQHIEGMTQDVLRNHLDAITIRSSVFEIHTTSVSEATGLTYSIEAIVNRQAAQGQILYWREGVGR